MLLLPCFFNLLVLMYLYVWHWFLKWVKFLYLVQLTWTHDRSAVKLLLQHYIRGVCEVNMELLAASGRSLSFRVFLCESSWNSKWWRCLMCLTCRNREQREDVQQDKDGQSTLRHGSPGDKQTGQTSRDRHQTAQKNTTAVRERFSPLQHFALNLLKTNVLNVYSRKTKNIVNS